MKAQFACMECGHKFRTVAAARFAAFGDRGCPKCGGSDIDLDISDEHAVRRQHDVAVAQQKLFRDGHPVRPADCIF